MIRGIDGRGKSAQENMDQKSENRKRFQDKQRLKRSHQTPSDRKYRKQPEPEPEKKQLPSNHERYVEIQQQEEDIFELTQLSIAKMSNEALGETSTQSKNYTTKQIQKMTSDEINSLLRPKAGISTLNSDLKSDSTLSPISKSNSTHNQTSTPHELQDEEDFLDSLL